MPAHVPIWHSPETDQFVSLGNAASRVFHGVTDAFTDDPKTLDNIAHTIAGRTRVFTRRSTSDFFVLIDKRDVYAGIMEEAGAMLRFTDGRPPLRNLSILKHELPRLIELLRKQFGPA